MRLRDFRVPEGPARVIAGMHQLYFGEVQRSVAENPHVFVAQSGQVGGVPFPHNGWRRVAADVTPDFHVVAHFGRYPVHFERLLQRDYRQTFEKMRKQKKKSKKLRKIIGIDALLSRRAGLLPQNNGGVVPAPFPHEVH